MTQHSPARVAVVRMPAASLPELDSVRPHAPIFSPRASGTRKRCFWASVPNMSRRAEHSPFPAGTEHDAVHRTPPVVGRHGQRHRGIDARELFDTDAVVHRGEAGAAILLRTL